MSVFTPGNNLTECYKFLDRETSTLLSYNTTRKYLFKAFRQNIKIYKLSPDYYNFIIASLTSSTIFEISKFTDQRKDSFSLYKLFNIMSSNPKFLTAPQLKRIRYLPDIDNTLPPHIALPSLHRAELDKYKKTIKKIRTRRNKYHAHFDVKYIRKGSSIKGLKLSYDEMNELIDSIREIMKTYAIVFEATHRVHTPLQLSNIKNTFRYIEKGFEKIKEDGEALRRGEFESVNRNTNWNWTLDEE